MPEIRDRLVDCFQNVFPSLSREQALAATVDNVENWDSLANFSLLTVIEEEFELQIPSDDLDHLRSFEAVESYLASR